MKYTYLTILIFSIVGMTLLDYKYKLSFFKYPSAAFKSTLIVMSLLLFADIVGINWKIFSTNTRYVSGLFIGSENLPIEEFFFLFMLCYFTLNIYQLFKRKYLDV